MQRLLKKVFQFLNPTFLREKLAKGLEKVILKGSQKDPLLYLGIISIVLFGAFLFAPYFIKITPPNFIETLFHSDLNQEFSRFNPYLIPKEIVKESPNLYLVQKNSLAAVAPAMMVTPQILGALATGIELEEAKREITEYIVESGDSLISIAERFNISLNTLLWANDLSQNSIIRSGQKLIILPVDGVIYYVKNGDTLSKISILYKADINEIITFNDLSGDGDIFVGDVLIIPGGVMPPKPAPVRYAPLATSYFICPISSPCRITQGLHFYNAVDFSHGSCGEPIYAAAAGTILKVKITESRSRWAFNGAGNHLTILHPNGVVTMYGHIALSLVNVGDTVSQGQIVALVGGQRGTPGAGSSSGCHLHFGVTGARNPFAR